MLAKLQITTIHTYVIHFLLLKKCEIDNNKLNPHNFELNEEDTTLWMRIESDIFDAIPHTQIYRPITVDNTLSLGIR